ncbi:hypothetical protein GWI33_009044 [Rhynchophorus ferrugineus]|uniref:Uncharacterized protein n=1 Tax=Rhynchophorus ferrugineus TaxID=354439 RepID=A0A834IF75_RHYFE|nr:hypothetical protein GWI33_009044 [Rhynchophorus ferrugineus]
MSEKIHGRVSPSNPPIPLTTFYIAGDQRTRVRITWWTSIHWGVDVESATRHCQVYGTGASTATWEKSGKMDDNDKFDRALTERGDPYRASTTYPSVARAPEGGAPTTDDRLVGSGNHKKSITDQETDDRGPFAEAKAERRMSYMYCRQMLQVQSKYDLPSVARSPESGAPTTDDRLVGPGNHKKSITHQETDDRGPFTEAERNWPALAGCRAAAAASFYARMSARSGGSSQGPSTLRWCGVIWDLCNELNERAAGCVYREKRERVGGDDGEREGRSTARGVRSDLVEGRETGRAGSFRETDELGRGAGGVGGGGSEAGCRAKPDGYLGARASATRSSAIEDCFRPEKRTVQERHPMMFGYVCFYFVRHLTIFRLTANCDISCWAASLCGEYGRGKFHIEIVDYAAAEGYRDNPDEKFVDAAVWRIEESGSRRARQDR